MPAKSHKARPMSEWRADLRRFAAGQLSFGVGGDRRAPKKGTEAFSIYSSILSCPRQKGRTIAAAFRGSKAPLPCSCGFHKSSDSAPSGGSPSVDSNATQTTRSGAAKAGAVAPGTCRASFY
ncbi:hypothetical protein FOZ63_020608, partial [Perkinsus olseni]